MRKSIFFVLVLLGALACEAPLGQQNDSGYFDLAQLIDGQVDQIGADTWNSNKVVIVNEATDQLQQRLDSSLLKEELAIFQTFDPGKSQFKNAFDVNQTGTITTYAKKEGENQSLQWVKVEDQGNALIITAEILEETSIYTNQKTMELRVVSGVLRNYALSGYQKMLFRDTTYFEMRASIE